MYCILTLDNHVESVGPYTPGHCDGQRNGLKSTRYSCFKPYDCAWNTHFSKLHSPFFLEPPQSLRKKALCSFETTRNKNQETWRRVPEDKNPERNSCGNPQDAQKFNLKSQASVVTRFRTITKSDCQLRHVCVSVRYADWLLADSQHNLYDKCLLPYIQYQTPDDGQYTCPKHVELYTKKIFFKATRSAVEKFPAFYGTQMFITVRKMYQLEANNFTMIFSNKWPLHVYIRTPEDGHVNVRNMQRPFMRKNHSKIVCIKLVHLPYLYI